MANQQGVVDPASAAPQGADPSTPSAVPVDPNVVPSAAPQGGSPNGLESTVRGLQSVVDRQQAQMLQLQQMIQQQQQPQPQPAQGNPFDPQSQPVEYWRHEQKMLAQEVASSTRRELLGVIEQAAKQQQDIQWQQAHPGVDINYVKAWGQANGVNNLDHALTLMNLPNQLQNVQQSAFNQFYQQARQPANTAMPLPPGGQPPQQQPKVSFEALLKQWNENPAIENTWTPELKAAFEQELNYRASQLRKEA